MRTRLNKVLERLRTSYWFVPTLLVALAIALSYATVWIDLVWRIDTGGQRFWVYGGRAEGAREVLSTIASAMITIASLTFSVTIVALTLAAQQFGSRLLYNFMRDRANQFVLGVFVATFVYSILVLRMVEGGESDAFVPQVSVTTALLLTLLSVGALIYFIHHTAEAIQADNVIEAVRQDLLDCAHALLPDGADASRREDEWAGAETMWQRLGENSAAVTARGSGFLQAVDIESLAALAAETRGVFRLGKRPGDFVMTGCELLRVSPAALLDDALAGTLNKHFILGARRTLIQDIQLPFQQLVEVALRALSPGINDPHTAIRCIDRLGDMLGEVLRRGEPPAVVRDKDGGIRLILELVTFASILGTAFDEIRRQASANPTVVARLLDTLLVLLDLAPTEAQRQAIGLQARLAYAQAIGQAGTEVERAALESRMRAIRARGAQTDGGRSRAAAAQTRDTV
jgi:uncharacterized membrane protein